MRVKFVTDIRARLGVTAYRLAKMLDVTTQAIDAYEKEGVSRMRLDILCRLRGVSGMTWGEFGKMLDGEFLAGDEPKKKGR